VLCLLGGLLLGTVVCLFITGGSLDHGYPIEVAVVRGLVGFMGVSLVGYFAELVVATAPPRAAETRAPARPREAPAVTAGPTAVPAAQPQDHIDDDAEDAMQRAA
jgi:hypothetical protein